MVEWRARHDAAPSRPLVLALDQGGHASRACLVDDDGAIRAQATVPIRTRHGPHGEVEHDPEELVESLRSAAGQVLAQLPALSGGAAASLDVAAAGLATQRSTLVCFERGSGAALSAAISWQDRRNADWLAGFAPHAARVQSLTGLPLSPHYGVGKMRWCLDHLAAVRAARLRGQLQIAPLAAFLMQRLTGREALVDPANASRTLLWDSARRDWSPELLELFGIEPALLPACAHTCADFGLLRRDFGSLRADDAAGIGPGIPLRAITGDQSAVPFGFGAPDEQTVYANLGTGAFLQRPLRSRPVDARPLLSSVLAVGPQAAWYCLEGTVNGAGSAVQAFASRCAIPEALLWGQLEQLRGSPALPLYVNGIGGLGSPYWRPQQPSYFIGAGSVVERFAAVVESIVFLLAANLDCMCRLGAGPHRVLLSGGLSGSDWLCRRLASTLDVPVLRTTQEATVLGVAALAARGTSGTSSTSTTGAAGEQVAGSAPAATRALRRFEPSELPAAERAALADRRTRFDAQLARGD